MVASNHLPSRDESRAIIGSMKRFSDIRGEYVQLIITIEFMKDIHGFFPNLSKELDLSCAAPNSKPSSSC